MTDSAHIYTPKDNSLRERVDVYQSIHQAFKNTQASLDQLENKLWLNRLGEKHEVVQAYEITERSLRMATKAIKKSELQLAQDQGIMSDGEVKEFLIIQNKLSMKKNQERSRLDEKDRDR